jgi:tetratricopeptide (TPR) repeat protein
MSLKARARNRLILLLVGLFLIAGAGGGYVAWRHIKTERTYASIRERGMAAAAAGEDQKVVDFLSTYLRRYPNDVDAMAAYAHSRPKIHQANGEELADTQRVLRNLLRLAPDRVAERRQLMLIYFQFGMMTEAKEQADNVLATAPDDADATDVKIGALMSLHTFDQAHDLALKRLKVAPTDWPVVMDLLQVFSQLGHPPEEILKTATLAVQAHPGDQGASLVKGYAYEMTNDLPNAVVALRAAATQPVRDKAIAFNLVQVLDGVSLHAESNHVLEELAKQGDPSVLRLLMRRYWEDGRLADAVALCSGPAASAMTDSDSQGLYADALRRTGKDSQATAIHARLASLKDDVLASAWVAIENMQATPSLETEHAARDACVAAAQKAPRNAYIIYFQALAEAQLGETNTAIDLWANAAQLSRTWAMPLLNETEALLTQGRIEPAERAAAQACRRAPNSTMAAVTLAKVWFAQVNNGATESVGKLNDLIDEIQKVDPGEEQTLEMRVSLLARAGNTAKASDTLRGMLNAQPPPSAATLLALANISRQWKLGLEQECLATLDKQFGLSPESALSEALDDYKNQKGADGLKLLQSAMASATGRSAIGFRLALASYLEATQDAGAIGAWASLGDAYPNDLAVQRAILTSKVAYGDRAFYDRTITRVRTLTGDESTTWKLARARWLLDGPTDAESTATATSLLADVLKTDANSVAANLLMSEAKAKAGDVSGASAQLEAAQKLAPKSTLLAMDMASMLQARGDFEAARQQLDLAAQGQNVTPDQLATTAFMLADQGDLQQAIKILEPLAADPKASDNIKLHLASYYCKTKQFDLAQNISDDLMKTPNQSSILLAAEIDMFRRNPTEAKAVLARLNDLKMPPEQLQLILGNFYYSFGAMADALQYFRAATKATPDNAAGWLSLIDCQAAMGKSGDVAATVAEALKHAPNDARLLSLQQETDLLTHIGNSRTEIQLLPMVVKDPAPTDPPIVTLRTIEETEAADERPGDVLQKLQKLSVELPRFWPAQTALTEAQLRYGRGEDAVQSADEEVTAFPTGTWPAELATYALASVGRWQEALRMAHTWRDRVVGDALTADMQIAQIQVALGDSNGAMATLTPYLSVPEVDPSQKTAMLFIEARALLRQNKPEDAAQVTWPTVLATPAIRPTWINFIARSLPAPIAEQWLTRMGTQLDSEPASAPTQVDLAVAWDLLSQRSGDKKYGQTARQMIDRLKQNPLTSANALFTSGMFLEEAGDFKGAEAAYRDSLAKGDNPAAKNNLAMLLVSHGGDLNEAADLAQQCVKASPQATFYDTLADVLAAGKKYDQAVAAMQTALRLEPDNAKWHVNLAKLLVASGKTDQAKLLIAELDLMTPGVRSLNDAYRQDLETLRRKVSGAAASTSH